MAPRKRNTENQGLPRRWRYRYGAYRYQVPKDEREKFGGKVELKLGATLAEAWRTWAAIMDEVEVKPGAIETVADLLDRYALEVIPTKKPKTQKNYKEMLPRLRRAFGSARLTDIEPHHIYQYHDARQAKTAAKREIQLLAAAFSQAVRWGAIKRHPFQGQVRLPNNAPRTRYVEDWEIVEALSITPRRKKGSVLMCQAYVRLKLLTGLTRADLLLLQPGKDFTDDGVDVTRHKTASSTGKRTIYEWTPELRAATRDALAARPVDISPYLFCNRRGKPYFNEATGTANGFESVWQRFMARVMSETRLKESFTEHDLRAKAGSDAESLEHARALLAHVDSGTTRRVYRRKPERVKPLR